MARRRPAVSLNPLPPLRPSVQPDGSIYDPREGIVRYPDGREEVLSITDAFAKNAALDAARPVVGRITQLTATPYKETPMTSPARSLPATQPAAPSTDLVPAGIPILQDEWAALSLDERNEALALFASETQETMRDLTPEFPKISTPSGGGQLWAMPDGTGAKEFEGVVVAHYKARVYWPIGDPISNTPPVCSSVDGRVPLTGKGPTGATTCAACSMNDWGTGKEGRGKACKERLNVFVLQSGAEIPALLSLPPTGIKPFSRYVIGLLNQKPIRPLTSCTTVFGLEKRQGQAGPAYSVATPRLGAPLTLPEMRAAVAMRNRFQSEMSRRGVTEADVTETAEHDEVIEAGAGAPDPKAGF